MPYLFFFLFTGQDTNEMRRQMNKDQKCIQDRNEELAHSRRKAEQHETEVRLLRSRIEELKKQQTSTEDEVIYFILPYVNHFLASVNFDDHASLFHLTLLTRIYAVIEYKRAFEIKFSEQMNLMDSRGKG